MAGYEKYWIGRAERRIAERHRYLDASILQIDHAYQAAMKELNREINRLLLQFARENGLTRAEAEALLQEKLSAGELDNLLQKLDAVTDEKIRLKLQKKLDASYYKGRISRKDALREAIRLQMAALAGQETEIATAAYRKVIRDEYYHNMFDQQKGLGFAFSFAELPERVIEQILQDNWSGKHYSRRIWGNTQVMARQIEETILKGTMLGTNSRKMARELNKIANTGMYACERLIRTETTYFTAMADLEAAKARGTKYVQFVATLDARTSPQCRAADGKIIPIEEAQPGKNIPPLHPWCRSVIIDVIKGLVHKVRRARDPITGKNILVPANMTYQEWQQMTKQQGVMLKDQKIGKKYKVPWDEVNTEEYDNKFVGLTGSEAADHSVWKHTKEILARRDGTDIEETYLIDAHTGSVLDHIIGENKNTVMPQNVLELLNSSAKDTIILLHNHPSGSSFSFMDINSISGVAAIKSIVAAGHNGMLYYMERPKYRSDLQTLYQGIKTLGIDRNRIWEILSEILDVKYERR